MKKRACTLLLLTASLFLSACGGEPDSQDPGKSGVSGSDQSQSGSGQSDTSGSVPPSSSESGYKPGSSSTETTSIDYTIGWTQDVLDIMEPHLGGHAIPFIDLPGRILATWIEATSTYDYSQGGYIREPAHLSIISTGGFDGALAGAAKLTYQKAGWAVEFNRETLAMHAEEENLGIVVDFYGEYDPNDKMTNPQIDIYYTEPFVIPTSGAWRNATLEVLQTIGVQAPHALPYTYLGTLAEEATIVNVSSGTQVEIQGSREAWDTYQNQIIAAARAAYPRSKKWVEGTATVTAGSGYYSSNYTGISFTKTFSDGYTVTAVLYGRSATDSYYSSDPKTPYLRVICSH